MRICFLVWLLVFAYAPNLLASADEIDFSRAQTLARRTEGKVFRDVVAPHWLPDNQHFWYQVTTGPNQREYVLVDASTGEIKRAASAEKLGVTESEHLSTSAQKSLVPKRTTHNGNETAIRFHNGTAAPVELFLGGSKWRT